jgi:hypothetical protein
VEEATVAKGRRKRQVRKNWCTYDVLLDWCSEVCFQFLVVMAICTNFLLLVCLYFLLLFRDSEIQVRRAEATGSFIWW